MNRYWYIPVKDLCTAKFHRYFQQKPAILGLPVNLKFLFPTPSPPPHSLFSPPPRQHPGIWHFESQVVKFPSLGPKMVCNCPTLLYGCSTDKYEKRKRQNSTLCSTLSQILFLYIIKLRSDKFSLVKLNIYFQTEHNASEGLSFQANTFQRTVLSRATWYLGSLQKCLPVNGQWSGFS